ncbi:TPA: host cell division inhibitor Icd-like protein [Escherichia coli]
MKMPERPVTGPGRSHAQNNHHTPHRMGGNRKYCLPAIAGGRYISPAGVNPPAGRENPFNEQKATQTRPASFFVSCHRATIPSGKARTVSMVALVGQPKGWPVSFCAGFLTPASVTAPYERENSGGDSLNLQKEAARMATTPTPLHPEFTFHFLAVRRSDLNDRPHRESVNAPDETTARRMLARDFVLLFAGRVPSQGVRHV